MNSIWHPLCLYHITKFRITEHTGFCPWGFIITGLNYKMQARIRSCSNTINWQQNAYFVSLISIFMFTVHGRFKIFSV